MMSGPKPAKSFKPASWLMTMDFIKRLIINDYLVMVVLSPQKSGKSTFVTLLSDKLSTMTTQVLVFSAQIPLEPALFESLPEHDKRTLVVIDDAHLLPLEVLSSLIQSYKKEGSQKRAYLCLVADPALNETLQLPEFETGLHTMTLGVLTPSETKTYALHLVQEGMRLSSRQWAAFYEETKGEIEAIHTQVNLMKGNSARVLSGFPQRTFWMGIFGIILTFAYFYSMNLFLRDTPAKTFNLSQQSYIPSYILGAKHQMVFPEPLKKNAPIVLASQVDEMRVTHHPIVDKVVVIPEGGHIS